MDSRIWKVIIAVAALHVLVLGSMFLIQHGCKSPPPETPVAKAEPAPPIPPSPTSVQTLQPSAYPVPVTPPVAPPEPPMQTAKTYTIKQGDTLGKIAKLEGVTLSDLNAANPGLDAKKLRIGQELHIPGGAGEAPGEAIAPSASAPSAPKAATTTYTVKKGDTLAKVAKAQGTTVTALKKINHLTSDTIQVGQKLKIPAPHESGDRPSRETKVAAAGASGSVAAEAGVATHIVQAGETPEIIAKKYGIKTKDLLAANGNPDPKKLKIGQKLVIPGKTGEAAPAAPAGPAPAVAPPTEATTPDTGLGTSGQTIMPPATPAPM